jgi:exopolysaccharide/PEP-CTERM locus tyrosine autokinase
MERIKTAVEKARGQRSRYGIGLGATQAQGTLGGNAGAAIGQVEYTQTRTVKVAQPFLREKRVMSGFTQNNVFTDAYKILCTQVLQKMRDAGWNALAVTSPGDGEGKTLTAINLAISMAMEVNQTVLLVDANLRHPSVHDYFGMKVETGLSDYLTANTPLENMLVHPGIGNFVILPGGKPLLNSSEMLGSPRMGQLVQELKQRYPSRIVLFDLPPLLSAADALAFAPHVDAALLVVQEAKTREEDITRAAELLGATKLLGTVLNKSISGDAVEKQPGWMARLFGRKD